MISAKKILILGSQGYIGSRLSLYLLNKGFFVFGVDVVDNNIILHSNFKFKKTKYELLEKDFILSFNNVICLAGLSDVRQCVNIQETNSNNIENFVGLLNKIDNSNTKLIYASSASVYGDRGIEEWKESDELPSYPKNLYDLSKTTIDKFAHLSNVKYYGLRFGTVCGKSLNQKYNLIINKMTSDIKKNGNINIINGYIHRAILGMNDLCNAIEKILLNNHEVGIYNLASFNTSVSNLGKIIADKFNGTITEEIISDTKFQYDFKLNCDKFKNIFDFQFNDNINSIIKELETEDIYTCL